MDKALTLQEQADKLGMKLLIESFTFSIPQENIHYLTNPRLVESGGEKWKARAVLRNVPVTRFVENLNGRIYPKPLWERIQKEKFAEGTGCLAGHPKENEEGDPGRTCGVWHNFRVLEDVGVADLYLVGDFGQTLLEKVEAGGKAGMSTVGFGEFLADNITVKTETYQLARMGDWVEDPSQGVFATMENSYIEPLKDGIYKKSEVQESIEEKFTNKNNKKENNNDSFLKENTGENAMSDTAKQFIESNYNNQVRVALKEARRSKDLVSSLQELESLYADLPKEMLNERAKLQDAINDVSKKLDEQVETTTKNLTEATKNLENITVKYNALVESNKQLTEKYKKSIVVLQKLGEGNPADNLNELQEDTLLMEKDIVQFKTERIDYLKENKEMESDLNIFKEEYPLMESDLNIFKEEYPLMVRDIAMFKTERKDFQESIYEASQIIQEQATDINYLKEELKKYGYNFEEVGGNDKNLKKDSIQLTEQEKENGDKNKEEDEDNKDNNKENNKEEEKKKESFFAKNFNQPPLTEEEKKEKEEEDKAEKKEMEEKEKKESLHKPYQRINFQKLMIEGEKEYPEKKKAEKQNSTVDPAMEKKTGKETTTQKESIISNFYEREVKKYSSLKDIKEDILSCDSIVEAVRITDAFVTNSYSKEKVITLNESFSTNNGRPDYLENRF